MEFSEQGRANLERHKKQKKDIAKLRAAKVIDMRVKGATMSAIGESLGISTYQVSRIVSRELAKAAKRNPQDIEKWRTLLVEQLDVLYLSCMQQLAARAPEAPWVELPGPDGKPHLQPDPKWWYKVRADWRETYDRLLNNLGKRARMLGVDVTAMAGTQQVVDHIDIAARHARIIFGGMTEEEMDVLEKRLITQIAAQDAGDNNATGTCADERPDVPAPAEGAGGAAEVQG